MLYIYYSIRNTFAKGHAKSSGSVRQSERVCFFIFAWIQRIIIGHPYRVCQSSCLHLINQRTIIILIV